MVDAGRWMDGWVATPPLFGPLVVLDRCGSWLYLLVRYVQFFPSIPVALMKAFSCSYGKPVDGLFRPQLLRFIALCRRRETSPQTSLPSARVLETAH